MKNKHCQTVATVYCLGKIGFLSHTYSILQYKGFAVQPSDANKTNGELLAWHIKYA